MIILIPDPFDPIDFFFFQLCPFCSYLLVVLVLCAARDIPLFSLTFRKIFFILFLYPYFTPILRREV